MNVFISWSGARSNAVAEILRDWIKCVLQATNPWISSRDIDRGSLWFNEVSEQLKDTTVGIICLTQENKNKPWILFEAGALAKGLASSRVMTLLIDLKPSDIRDPLAQLNHTEPDKLGMWHLLETLNRNLETGRLDDRILAQVFETYWPRFSTAFEIALKQNELAETFEKRGPDDILGEILENTRSLNSRISRLESSRFIMNDGASFQQNIVAGLSGEALEWWREAKIDMSNPNHIQATIFFKVDKEPSIVVQNELTSFLKRAYGNYSLKYTPIPNTDDLT